jgi:hypothetical protein
MADLDLPPGIRVFTCDLGQVLHKGRNVIAMEARGAKFYFAGPVFAQPTAMGRVEGYRLPATCASKSPAVGGGRGVPGYG